MIRKVDQVSANHNLFAFMRRALRDKTLERTKAAAHTALGQNKSTERSFSSREIKHQRNS